MRSCEARVNGQAPNPQDALSLADLSLVNTGETDEIGIGGITVCWSKSDKLALMEPLAGWQISRGDHAVTFLPVNSSARLPLGEICEMGWLRLEKPARIHVKIVSDDR